MGKNKKKRKKSIIAKEDIGKLLLDLGKIMFGTVFLGGVLRGTIPHYVMAALGLALTMLLFTAGIAVLTKRKET